MRSGGMVAVPLVLMLLAPAAADHAQDPQGDGTHVVFDHVKGNEWWVEVRVTGDEPIGAVSARDDGGAWMALDKKDWGVWAGSFHIEPGHRVQFRAEAAGETTRSCWFTHPGGDEQCGEAAAGVTFDHRGGNEWWVQVDVSGAPDRVQAMDTGGAWTELQRKDWGDWAASFHIEPGHEVRFRALVAGQWQESCWFTHPGGSTPSGGETCAGGTSAEPEPALRFDHRGGNEWWVEVRLEGSYEVHVVHAEDSGGETKRLRLSDWGNWVGSFHIEPGHDVRFHVNQRDGTPAQTSCWFTHPDGKTPTGGQTCTGTAHEPDPAPEPTVDVAFGPKAGNAWWIEAIVVGDGEPIESVQARAVGGAWHDLSYRDWGAWAGSFHVPSGAEVEFRATTPNGTDVSDRFTWPDARPVGSDGSWPEEGSYARIDETIQHAPGIYTQRYWDHVYHDGRWWHHYEGWFDHDPSSKEAGRTPEEEWGRMAPRSCETDVAPGDEACGEVKRMDSEDTHQNGDPVTVATWYGEHIADCNCNNDYYEWDQATGILIGYHNSGTSWRDQLLLDTDAPMRTV